MGKAIIVSHAGKGQYVVDVVYDAEYIQKIIDKLEEDYAHLKFNDLLKAIDERDSQQAIVNEAVAAFNAAVADYNDDPTEENRKNVENLTIETLRKSEAYIQSKLQVSLVESRMDSLYKRILLLYNYRKESKRNILWCVDLADGKRDRKLLWPGTEVGVAEISGQEEIGQNLVASYEPGNPAYDSARDGRLMNVAGLTHFELFYNTAIMPGWQTWRHRYRSGEIIDGDMTNGWTVRLDNTKTKVFLPEGGEIEVNNIAAGFASEQRELIGVHAVYMNCDDEAFGVGDKVVIDLTISGPATGYVTSATIIGFVEKPKACFEAQFAYYVTGALLEYQGIKRTGGDWIMQSPYSTDLTTYMATYGVKPRSWIGRDPDEDPVTLEFLYPSNALGVYLSGALIATAPVDQAWRILGAALSPNQKYIYTVMSYSGQERYVWVKRYNRATSTWESTSSFDIGVESLSYLNEFHFNASCTRALSMARFTHGARRTPQADPAPGYEWTTNLHQYLQHWYEKISITIEVPDASTLSAAGVSCENQGVQGRLLGDEHYVRTLDQDGWTYKVDLQQWLQFSGSNQTHTGFDGDTEIVGSLIGQGKWESKGFSNAESNEGLGWIFITQEITTSGQTSIDWHNSAMGDLMPYFLEARGGYVRYTLDGGGETYESNSTLRYEYSRSGPTLIDLSQRISVHDGEGQEVVSTTTQTGPQSILTVSDDSTWERGVFFAGTKLDDSTQETTSQHDETNWAYIPVAMSPDDPTSELHYKYDRTGYDITGTGGENILPLSHNYTSVSAAKSANNRFCAAWVHTRSPGFATVYGDFLTDGDLSTLDGGSGARTYEKIHAV